MRPLILGATVGFTLLAGVNVAAAQAVITTTPHGTQTHGSVSFAPEHGAIIREHATGQHFSSVQDPNIHAQVGATLPGSVQLHPLPDRLVTQVPAARSYQYSIINNRHVVVDPGTRRVIHVVE